MDRFTHLDEQGRARMVDVSAKAPTRREAAARATVAVAPETLRAILAGQVKKGSVFAVAQTAGVMAAKKTAELIPLCHPLPLTGVDLDFQVDEAAALVHITARVRTVAPTGVEMEALTAASVAALTVYDMCKALQKDIVIREIVLLEKMGGKSGDFRREP